MSELLTQYPWLCILPSAVTLLIAVISRQVIVSLTVGIMTGVVILKGFSRGSLQLIIDKAMGIFYSEGSLAKDEIFLIVFLWMMGIITYMIGRSGVVSAFTNYVLARIRSRRTGQLLVIFLGFLIFIDDYLNSLVVGNVSRPLCDRLGISRPKLAYLLDSTAAPVCVLAPLSSWGAAIIAVMNLTLTKYSIKNLTGLSFFLQTIKYNFYPILTLVLMIMAVIIKADFGTMRKFEAIAICNNPLEAKTNKNHTHFYQVLGLLVPIFSLLIVSILGLFITGYITRGSSGSLISLIESSDLGLSLLVGGGISIISCLLVSERDKVGIQSFLKDTYEGLKLMLPVIIILILAWLLAAISAELEVGKYIISFLRRNKEVGLEYMPSIIFFIASLMSFSIGSSYSTFTMMLPITAEIASSGDSSMLIPMSAACLGGAVFGDHCSPISDTTILSSTGADCRHMDHVISQLPYCVLVACLSLIGYTILGYTDNINLAYGSMVSMIVLTVLYLKSSSKTTLRL